MSKKGLFLWLLLLSLAAAPLACDQARSKFDQISLGMTRQQVEKLLGKPATVTGDPATPTATWTYGKEKLVIQFNQDRVQLKQLAPWRPARPNSKPPGCSRGSRAVLGISIPWGGETPK